MTGFKLYRDRWVSLRCISKKWCWEVFCCCFPPFFFFKQYYFPSLTLKMWMRTVPMQDFHCFKTCHLIPHYTSLKLVIIRTKEKYRENTKGKHQYCITLNHSIFIAQHEFVFQSKFLFLSLLFPLVSFIFKHGWIISNFWEFGHSENSSPKSLFWHFRLQAFLRKFPFISFNLQKLGS